jgi:hypothetical protein
MGSENVDQDRLYLAGVFFCVLARVTYVTFIYKKKAVGLSDLIALTGMISFNLS